MLQSIMITVKYVLIFGSFWNYAKFKYLSIFSAIPYSLTNHCSPPLVCNNQFNKNLTASRVSVCANCQNKTGNLEKKKSYKHFGTVSMPNCDVLLRFASSQFDYEMNEKFKIWADTCIHTIECRWNLIENSVDYARFGAFLHYPTIYPTRILIALK